MSERVQAWVAVTLGALCARQADASSIPEWVFFIAAAVWSGFGLWSALELLRSSR